MFAHELDRRLNPITTRSRGILLGSILTVLIVAALVSARTVPFLYGLLVAGFLVAAAARGLLERAIPRRGSVAVHLFVFLFYAFASAAWAYEPSTSFLAVGLALVVAAGTLVLMQLLDEESRPNLLHLGEGLWIGLLVGLGYLFIEVVGGQSIKIWIYNLLEMRPGDLPHAEYFVWSGSKITFISPEDLTRNMAPVTLFLWPAVMAARGTLSRRSGLIVAWLTIVLAGTVIMLTNHESSKLAFLAALATFGGACLGARLMGRVVATGWVIVCLAVLPSALILHRLDLHNASWLQHSARHRIIIWNYTAEQILKAPLLGVGARTTYVLGPQMPVATEPDEAFPRTLSVHSHSVYLQTWFELGLIGATLLTLLGLSILQAIRSLTPRLKPYAYATFVSSVAMAASSYGMWQTWFVSLFGVTAAIFALGSVLLAGRSQPIEAAGAHTPERDVPLEA